MVVKRATTIVEDEESKMDVDDTGDIKPAVQALPTSDLDDTDRRSTTYVVQVSSISYTLNAVTHSQRTPHERRRFSHERC